jgi:hypothetical protein
MTAEVLSESFVKKEKKREALGGSIAEKGV